MSGFEETREQELYRVFSFQTPYSNRQAVLLSWDLLRMGQEVIKSSLSNTETQDSKIGTLIAARVILEAAGEMSRTSMKPDRERSQIDPEQEETDRRNTEQEARRVRREIRLQLDLVGGTASETPKSARRTDAQRASEIHWRSVCHTEIARERVIAELGARTAEGGERETTTARRVEQARTIQMIGMWPPVMSHHSWSMEPDNSSDERLHSRATEARRTTEEVMTETARRLNRELTMEVSHMIQLFPKVEREIRDTTVPATGCVSGFRYGADIVEGTPPAAFLERYGMNEDSTPVTADQKGDEIYSGALAWMAFVHEDRRIAKLITEPYPTGFPGQVATENAERTAETLIRYLIKGEGTDIPREIAENFCQAAKANKKVAESGLHTVRPRDLEALMESAKRDGMPRGATATMTRKLTHDDLHVSRYICQQGNYEWTRSASVQQAKSVLSAARNQGMDQHGICNMARAMGYNPWELEEETPDTDPETVERIFRQAISIGIPEETALGMVRSLDWKRGRE